MFNFFRKKEIPLSEIDYNFYYTNDKIKDISLTNHQIGLLNVTSGKIVVCDPLVSLGYVEHLNRMIEPGKYPVVICIANHDSFWERYSLAKMVIREEVATKWELAYTKSSEKEVLKLKKWEFFGFPVDTGLGCFCDFDTQNLYNKFDDDFMSKNDDTNIYDGYFAERFKENATDKNNPSDAWNWLNWEVPDTKNNVIMFNSWFGDWFYPTYWGLNENNEVVSLLIDFLVFDQ